MKRIVFLFLLLFINGIGYCQTWNTVAYNNFDGGVNCFEVYHDKLIITAGYDSDRMVEWDETVIDTIPFGDAAIPDAFCLYDDKLVIAGPFSSVLDTLYTERIAAWDGEKWSALSHSWNNSITRIYAMEVYNGELYVGGIMSKIDGVNVHHIAKWNGSQWSDVGGGINLGATRIEDMAVYNGELYVGGRFYSAGGVVCNNIARWNGSQWNDVNGGTNENVYTMVIDTVNNKLYAGGGFTMAGSIPARCIAGWDGSNWSSLGSGILFTYEIGIYQDTLYAATPTLNNLPTDTILSKWDGTKWIPIFGFNSNINAIQEYKGNLYVGGGFELMPGGEEANYIACYGNNCPEPLSINEQTNKIGFKIYPNPNTGQITIEWEPLTAADFITITTIEGKETERIKITRQENKISLSTASWAKGIYFFSLFEGTRKLAGQKIVVE